MNDCFKTQNVFQQNSKSILRHSFELIGKYFQLILKRKPLNYLGGKTVLGQPVWQGLFLCMSVISNYCMFLFYKISSFPRTLHKTNIQSFTGNPSFVLEASCNMEPRNTVSSLGFIDRNICISSSAHNSFQGSQV